MAETNAPQEPVTPDQAPVAELEYTHTAFERWIIDHKKQLITAGVVLGLGFVGYYTLGFVREARNNAAGDAYSQATTIDEFKKVAEDYSGRPGGGNALFTVGRMQLEDQRLDEAVKTFQNFLAEYPSHPLAEQAKFREAEATLAKGETEAALGKYQGFLVAHAKSSLRGAVHQRIGDLLAKSGKIEEAKAEYDKIAADQTDKQFKKQADDLKKVLDQEAPVVIPFVEEKPTPAPGAPTAPGANPPGLSIPSLTPPSSDLNTPGLSLTPEPTAPSAPTLVPTPEATTPAPAAPTVPSLTPAPAPAAPAAPAPVPTPSATPK